MRNYRDTMGYLCFAKIWTLASSSWTVNLCHLSLVGHPHSCTELRVKNQISRPPGSPLGSPCEAGYSGYKSRDTWDPVFSRGSLRCQERNRVTGSAVPLASKTNQVSTYLSSSRPNRILTPFSLFHFSSTALGFQLESLRLPIESMPQDRDRDQSKPYFVRQRKS